MAALAYLAGFLNRPHVVESERAGSGDNRAQLGRIGACTTARHGHRHNHRRRHTTPGGKSPINRPPAYSVLMTTVRMTLSAKVWPFASHAGHR